MKLLKYLSVFDSDSDVLVAFDDIYLRNRWYDLDCTYSKGVFYNNIEKPRLKSDLVPLNEDVEEADSRSLDFVEDGTLHSIVFDPPFLFRHRKSQNNDKISRRFSYFNGYDELCDMYKKSLDCFYKKLDNGGYIFFKCQDMTDNKFYCTHNFIINYATQNGFELKDIAIKTTKSKLQRDAKQQNCLAKTHCFWLVLRKKKKISKPILWRKRKNGII